MNTLQVMLIAGLLAPIATSSTLAAYHLAGISASLQKMANSGVTLADSDARP